MSDMFDKGGFPYLQFLMLLFISDTKILNS